MKQKTIVFALAMLFLGSVFAQEKINIKVIVPHKTDEVYITGNQKSLGNWDPGTVKMTKISDFEREIITDISYPAEFKFTKGKWESEGIINSIDSNPNQKLLDEHSRHIFVIKGWANDIDAESPGIDYGIKKLQSKYLEAERLIKIALPDNYDPSKKYPVFYTTDAGWNLFSVAKNYISNLSLDEYKLMPECIVVGIVHGKTNDRSNRNDDLDVDYGETGKKFKNFIFKELVPYINNRYSTSDFNPTALSTIISYYLKKKIRLEGLFHYQLISIVLMFAKKWVILSKIIRVNPCIISWQTQHTILLIELKQEMIMKKFMRLT